MIKTKINRLKIALAAIVVFASNFLFLGSFAHAASLTNSYIRLNRMGSGATSSFRLVFKTASASATALTIDFNGADSTTWSGSTGNVHSGSMTSSIATCATETSSTGLPGTLTITGASAHTVSITGITALSTTTQYCLDFTDTDAVTIPTTSTEYHPTITESSGATDSTTVAVYTVASGGDQVTVNATVPPSFNFAISGCASNTDNFTANLSSASVGATAGCDITVNTNAITGWLAWASDSQTGLHSTVASTTIASKTPGTNATLTSNPGTPAYVFSVSSITQGSGGGTTSATNAYGNGSGSVAGANQGSGLDSTLRPVATSTGTADTAVVHVKSYAAINAVTPAASDYQDVITIVGAGSF